MTAQIQSSLRPPTQSTNIIGLASARLFCGTQASIFSILRASNLSTALAGGRTDRGKDMILDQKGLNQAIDAYETTTRKAVDAARKLVVPLPTCIRFSTGALNASTIEELSAKAPKLAQGEGKQKKRGFLYIYQLQDECEVEPLLVTAALLEAKTNDVIVGKLPAVNLMHSGRVLYVGRSWNVQSRTREHLKADCSKKTYALRFAAWAEEFDLSVELLIWEFPGITDLTLQVVEDGLWDRLRPLFGRRGAK
ncbi:hypothetical protein [Pseudomonas sp. PSPC2-3]|uniref:hypothetical protein n=1 Tax=Pseudomonas sp. PSPC2-3 TaxID=2804561 RepID=UPI003CF9DBD9